MVERLDVESYVFNTGRVGTEDVGVETSVTILRELARETVTWTDDEATGLTVPADVPGVDVERFDVAAVDDHERRLRELRAERRAYLWEFDDLDEDVVGAVY